MLFEIESLTSLHCADQASRKSTSIWTCTVLTLKPPITSAAADILNYFLNHIFFSEKIRLDISFESSASRLFTWNVNPYFHGKAIRTLLPQYCLVVEWLIYSHIASPPFPSKVLKVNEIYHRNSTKRCIFIYFPIQKSLKITSKISSDVTLPVMLPKCLSPRRKHWAAKTMSLSSIISLYLCKLWTHFWRLSLCRSWVRLGCPINGSPHLKEKKCSKYCNIWNPMQMNRIVRKRTFYVRPAKIQISLRIRAVWSESSLDAFWIAKDAKFIHADKEESDQTVRMRRLIWVFDGRTCHMAHFLTWRFKQFP